MRLSASYFRLKGNQWLPEILDEPALMNRVMSAGEQWGWTLRETGLVRILFDTGCRVHEACQLSVADWVQSGLCDVNYFGRLATIRMAGWVG